MSTVPKLTYAKVGKASKTRAESASSELLRSGGEPKQDLFSQLNQDNLNYIKKQLKMKKNRSDIDRPTSPSRDPYEAIDLNEDQATQRYKIYQKYRGDQEVSEKQPHLEDTQRRSDEEKPLKILLPQDIEEDYHPPQSEYPKQQVKQREHISSSHLGTTFNKKQEKSQTNMTKMYHSLPYEDPKKRIVSIQGFFGEVASVNLKQDYGQFLESLQEYIVDLNHSKTLQGQSNRKGNEGIESYPKKSASREGSQYNKVKSKTDLEFNEDKYNSNIDKKKDKYTESKNNLKRGYSKNQQSNNSNSFITNDENDLSKQLKQEQYYNIMMAQGMEKLKIQLKNQEKTIKALQTENQLLKEDLRHIKTQQEIIQNQKKHYYDHYSNKYDQHSKEKNIVNDQNRLKLEFQSIGQHHRHASTNPNRTSYRTISSARPTGDFNQELFQPFATTKQSQEENRQKNRKERGSVEKWEGQYHEFLTEEKKCFKFPRGSRRGKEGVF